MNLLNDGIRYAYSSIFCENLQKHCFLIVIQILVQLVQLVGQLVQLLYVLYS